MYYNDGYTLYFKKWLKLRCLKALPLTDDGSPSSQWEYTILMTETGTEILTN